MHRTEPNYNIQTYIWFTFAHRIVPHQKLKDLYMKQEMNDDQQIYIQIDKQDAPQVSAREW